MKNTVLKNLLYLLLTFSSLTVSAYDVDTHFYGTYSLARFAGIKHEIALKIATGAQWMDESYISDPVTMILLPDVGVKKRRLLHFPGSRLASKLSQDTIPLTTDPSSGSKLLLFTETEADHEFATEMFTEGLMEGNLMKASAGLHTLEDSFAHAGTIAEIGHAHFWHHPDRPYVDKESVEKYFKMTRSVLKAMVAIRTLLPPDSVDPLVKFSTTANYLLDADTLANMYEQNSDVQNTVSHKILNDKNFVEFALDHTFKRAYESKYINSGYESYLSRFEPNQDTYQAASSIVKNLPPDMIKFETVMKDRGGPKEITQDYLLSMGGVENLIENVIHGLLRGIVPKPLSVYHRFEKEEDGPVWEKELTLRETNMQKLINTLYKKKIKFIKNNTSGADGYIKELSQNPEANPVLPTQNNSGVEYVTYSLQEKFKFNNIIFNFLFPKLSTSLKGDQDKIMKIAGSIIEMKNEASANASLKDKIRSGFSDVQKATANIPLIIGHSDILSLANEDVKTAHIKPNEMNRYFTVLSLVEKQKTNGIFKILK